MKKNTLCLLVLAAMLGATTLAQSQQAPKPENQIKWRQSAFQTIGWSTGRIKANLDGTYNKDEVVKAAGAIAALANTNLLSLFTPGSETGKGWRDTTVKPEFFKDTARAAELNNAFAKEANELLRVAQTGDAAAVKDQHGKLTRACKACHDDFRNSN